LKPVTARREANSKGTIYIRDNSISRNNEKNIGVPAVRTQEQCISFHGNLRKTLEEVENFVKVRQKRVKLPFFV
jgi:hypothetical protein